MTFNSKIIPRKNVALDNVNDIVMRGIISVVENNGSSIWKGTMTDLRSSVIRMLSKKQRTILPGSPGALRIVINRVVNRLRSRGISVRFGRASDHTRTRFVRFAK